MRQIIVTNRSTVLRDADVAAFTLGALQKQVSRDFAPLWKLDCKLGFNSAPPASAEQIVVADDSDQAGALGYHDEARGGQPIGFVFAKTTLDAGERWTATLSHELLEMLADPWCDLASQGAWKGRPALLAYETADPVENDEYAIDGQAVSNFVTPFWFLPKAQIPAGTKTDFLGKLGGRPMTLSKGGYLSFAYAVGRWQQAFADKTPEHQRNVHAYSRRGRRVRRAAPV
jgi:hypothetical protein